MNQTFKTPKGTELPMLDLRGKPYLQVAHRLVWFREEHPDWPIITEIVEQDQTHAIVRATIKLNNLVDGVLATAVKREDKVSFPDFLEKAETGAIGRALALCGYGTQFAPELDEGERLADSPIAPAKPATRTFTAVKPSTPVEKKEIALLAETKLGAKTGDGADILAKLNEKFGMSLASSNDINHIKADTIIKALGAMPDLPPFES